MKTSAINRVCRAFEPSNRVPPGSQTRALSPRSRVRCGAFCLATFFAVTLCVVPFQHNAFGQDSKVSEKAKPSGAAPGQAPKKGERENMQQLVHDIMAARLARELELDDKETVTLIRRLEEFRSQQGMLQRKRQEMLKSLKAILKTHAPEADIEKTLREIQSLDAKLQELKRTAFEKVGEGMTTTRRAKLYVFYNEFDSEMRRLIQKAREKSAQGRRIPGDAPPARQPEGVIQPKEGDK